MQRATSSALLAAQLVAALTSAPRSSAQKDLPRAGCYFDNLTVVNSTLVHRQLRHPVCAERGQGMCSEAELTHETCGHACVERGFQLAGLEDHQCFCGDNLTNVSAVVPRSKCFQSCPAAPPWKQETCGGPPGVITAIEVFPAASVGPVRLAPVPSEPAKSDARWVGAGSIISTGLGTGHGTYACQPYCFVHTDGEWSCVMTFNNQSYVEGEPGEHMVALNTKDEGKSWSPMVVIEPYFQASTDHVSAYGSITCRTDGSRCFAIYIYNENNVSHTPGNNASKGFRADMLGEFVWRYSDDRGKSWSPDAYRIPVPETFIERHNTWNGTVQIMWEVDHVKVENGSAMFAFTKIGTYDVAPPEEIYVAVSHNLLESGIDPMNVLWEFWPDEDHGIEVVGGSPKWNHTNDADGKWCAAHVLYPHRQFHPDFPRKVNGLGIAEEGHVMPLADGRRFHVVFRTTLGYLGASTSLPGPEGPRKHWAPSTFARYLPVLPEGGVRMAVGGPLGHESYAAAGTWAERARNFHLKNPRGPISPKKQPNGLWLMTYYNNAHGTVFGAAESINDRNNMFLTCGHELDGTVLWTQPELLLFDRDRPHGHGYPDIVLAKSGEHYLTETYKVAPYATARTHHIPKKLVNMLYAQHTYAEHTDEGLVYTLPPPAPSPPVLHTSAAADPPPLQFVKLDMPKHTQLFPDLWKVPADEYRFGLTLEFWIKPPPLRKAVVDSDWLFGSYKVDEAGVQQSGLALRQDWSGNVTVEVLGNGGPAAGASGFRHSHSTDRACAAQLAEEGIHHFAVTLDAGPLMLMFFVDGKLCDGGPLPSGPGATVLRVDEVPFEKMINRGRPSGTGFSLLPLTIGNIANGGTLVVNPRIAHGRVYNRSLYTTELIGNWRHGLQLDDANRKPRLSWMMRIESLDSAG